MRHRVRVWTLVVLLAGGTFTSAQETPSVTAQREAMKKLDFWIGQWKGTGSVQMGPGQKKETGITETVQPKLGGLALLIEGVGQATAGPGGKEVVTHDALGIVNYDDKTKRYRFSYYKAGDQAGESELKLIDGGLEWERRVGPTTIRFTARISGDRWHEIGEASQDGKTWHKFMEMTLERQKPAGAARRP